MKKKFIIILAIILVLGTAVAIYFIVKSKNTNSQTVAMPVHYFNNSGTEIYFDTADNTLKTSSFDNKIINKSLIQLSQKPDFIELSPSNNAFLTVTNKSGVNSDTGTLLVRSLDNSFQDYTLTNAYSPHFLDDQRVIFSKDDGKNISMSVYDLKTKTSKQIPLDRNVPVEIEVMDGSTALIYDLSSDVGDNTLERVDLNSGSIIKVDSGYGLKAKTVYDSNYYGVLKIDKTSTDSKLIKSDGSIALELKDVPLDNISWTSKADLAVFVQSKVLYKYDLASGVKNKIADISSTVIGVELADPNKVTVLSPTGQQDYVVK